MKCSDCKCFKTVDCTVNPEGKDCISAEAFDCFISSAGDGSPSVSVNADMDSKKADGIVLFWLGAAILFIGIVIGMCLFFIDFLDKDFFGIAITFLIGAAVGVLLMIKGAISFLVGKDKEILQRKLKESEDSQSEHETEESKHPLA